ncbi:MAG: hypothetical protein WC554_05835 [Clostridia bacterium]
MADWGQALGAGLTAFGAGMTGGDPMASGMAYLRQQEDMASKVREAELVSGVYSALYGEGDQSDASAPMDVASGPSKAKSAGDPYGKVLSYFDAKKIPKPKTFGELEKVIEAASLPAKQLKERQDLLIGEETLAEKREDRANAPLKRSKLESDIESTKVGTEAKKAKLPRTLDEFLYFSDRENPDLGISNIVSKIPVTVAKSIALDADALLNAEYKGVPVNPNMSPGEAFMTAMTRSKFIKDNAILWGHKYAPAEGMTPRPSNQGESMSTEPYSPSTSMSAASTQPVSQPSATPTPMPQQAAPQAQGQGQGQGGKLKQESQQYSNDLQGKVNSGVLSVEEAAYLFEKKYGPKKR